jgi:hypothetical protein
MNAISSMKQETAIRFLLFIIVSITLFHVGVLDTIVPPDIIWGGQLSSTSEMYLLETISILVALYLIFVLLIKGSFFRPILSPKLVKYSLWFFLILFILNIIGNLLSKTTTEQTFALLTMAISFLLWTVLTKQEL